MDLLRIDSLFLRIFFSLLVSKVRRLLSSMRWPEREQEILKRRSAASIGSPSLTWTVMSTILGPSAGRSGQREPVQARWRQRPAHESAHPACGDGGVDGQTREHTVPASH